MITVLALIAFTGLVILGVHQTTRDGMLLSFLGQDYQSGMQAVMEEAAAQDALVEKDGNYGIEIDGQFRTLEEVFSPNPIQRLLAPISTPLTECPTCMSSVWTVVVFGLYFGIGPMAVLVLAPFAVAGLIQVLAPIRSLYNLK